MSSLGSSFSSLKGLLQKGKKKQVPFSDLFIWFQDILEKNNAALAIIADMDGKTGGDFIFDKKYLSDNVKKLAELVRRNAYNLNYITDNRYPELYGVIEGIIKKLEADLSGKITASEVPKIYFLDKIEDGMEDVVGCKAYNISRIMALSEVGIPDGFVVTIGGFRDYLAYNNLFEAIDTALEKCKNEPEAIESISNGLRLKLLGGEIPPSLRRHLLAAGEQLCGARQDRCRLAVRSSGIGEDGSLSFAGIHDSLLNVQFHELLSSYKKVLASLYSKAALEYRLKMDILSLEMAMPVLYQKMVKSRVSGVLFTLDPNDPDRDESILSAGSGIGEAVGGDSEVDTFRVLRNHPYTVVNQQVGSKTHSPASEKPDVSPMKDPCLTHDEIVAIMDTGLLLERFFKVPMDIEWGIDEDGQLWILQARQLNIPASALAQHTQQKNVADGYPVIFRNRGMVAYRGIGAGPVYIVKDEQDLGKFPKGGVLVSQFSPPWLARAIPRASAVITDIGSVTGHMATVAREFRIPTIVGAQIATQLLEAGRKITVDTEKNIVYEGIVQELIRYKLLEKPSFETTPEFQILRRLLKKIAPLYLTNPDAPNFTPKGCRTLHDVMRFIHEKAFQSLVKSGKNSRSFIKRGGKRLKTDMPIDLVLIDIGGGLAKTAKEEVCVDPEDITSIPMKAIWKGLSSPGTWSTEPVPVDMKGFMSSMTRTQGTEIMGNALPNVNLAVLGADYVNLSMPLGYHFTTVIASIGSSPQNNNISFRFAGGVTDITRRSRRASLIAKILEVIGFKVEITGDLVIASSVNLMEENMARQLFVIGKLIGFTRQLDVLLKNDEDIDYYFNKFMEQIDNPANPQ